MNDFYKRFGLSTDVDAAQKLFINRLAHTVFHDWQHKYYKYGEFEFQKAVQFGIGVRADSGYVLTHDVSTSFHVFLAAIEWAYIYAKANTDAKKELDMLVDAALRMAEADMGIRWEKGKFWPAGAALLDSALASDVLAWLRKNEYQTVYLPFEKGLMHFMGAKKDQRILSDVVRDMYESLEALAGVLLNKPKPDLSALREQLIAKLRATDAYKRLLAEYVNYANIYRHAAQPGQEKPALSEREVESFIYMTGIFIRLAM